MNKEQPTNPFRNQLAAALNHFQDPAWLGQHSPLATAYFLGDYLLNQPKNNTAVGRGHALRSLLRTTADDLAKGVNGENDHLSTLLSMSYFRPRPVPQVCSSLNISRATYYRYREKALLLLELALINRLKPSLRLEAPPPKPDLFGRTKVIQNCLSVLKGGNSLAILGNSGVGKTMLGAHLAGRWSPKPVFWFTLKPKFNDRLHSLLFSLGHFLQSLGQSRLWLQLVASTAMEAHQIDHEILISLVRNDLTREDQAIPLLCFDDVDLLQPLEVEQHARIHAFLQSLHGLVPIVFMGQQITIEVDHRQMMGGFSDLETKRFLAKAEIELAPADINALSEFTRNIPYLLDLFAILHRSGESLSEALSALSTAPSTELLLNRIWQRLLPEEVDMLTRLSVFRRPIPDDIWPDSQPHLRSLIARRLILQNSVGELYFIPALRSIIYARLAAEEKESHHLEAADVRANLADYTAAAYHFIQGGRPEMAVRIWYENRRQEINQGQGITALDLFSNLSANLLTQEDREVLVLIRNQLRLIQGSYREITKDLHSFNWETPLFKARSKRIEGDAAYERSQFDSAINAYRDGIDILFDIEYELAMSHKEIAKAYAHKPDMKAAWRAALMAEYEVENMKGSIQNDQGSFHQAQNHFENALRLAIDLNHVEGEGKTRNNLAWTLQQLGAYQRANEEWEKAGACYRQVGRLTMDAGVKVNQASLLILMGNPELAVERLLGALKTFQSLGFSRGVTIAYYNLAEGYLALNQLEEAERSAWRSIEGGEHSVLPASLYVLAEISYAKKNFQDAESLCRNAIERAEAIDNALIGAYGWRTLGKVFFAQQQKEEGKDALNRALDYFESQQLSHEVTAIREIILEFAID